QSRSIIVFSLKRAIIAASSYPWRAVGIQSDDQPSASQREAKAVTFLCGGLGVGRSCVVLSCFVGFNSGAQPISTVLLRVGENGSALLAVVLCRRLERRRGLIDDGAEFRILLHRSRCGGCAHVDLPSQ